MRNRAGSLLERLRSIRTMRQVLIGTAAIAAISIALPCLIILACASALLPAAPPAMIGMMLLIRVVVGLCVIAPIGFILLHLIRLQGDAVEASERASRYDALTGAMSRGYFLSTARQALPAGGGLMMVDADCFKAVNDRFGHHIGDEALRLMAQVMRETFGSDAVIGRLGGEEFAVLLPQAHAARTEAAGEALCEAMRAAGQMICGQPVGLTLSIGAVLVEAGGNLEQNLRSADLLLYEAKKAGRDQLVMRRAETDIATLAAVAASMRRKEQAWPQSAVSSSALTR